MPTAPLTAVVHDAVRRWFQEAHKEAQRGDVVGHSFLALHTDLPVWERLAVAHPPLPVGLHPEHTSGVKDLNVFDDTSHSCACMSSA